MIAVIKNIADSCGQSSIGPTGILAILTFLLAFIVAFIGYQQFLLAREKFKLDLFDRRFAVYKATQTFITEVINVNANTAKDAGKWIGQYQRDAGTAKFLFDDELFNYLHNILAKGCLVVHTKVLGMSRIRQCWDYWLDTARASKDANDMFCFIAMIVPSLEELKIWYEKRGFKLFPVKNLPYPWAWYPNAPQEWLKSNPNLIEHDAQ
jgi:hypothetical protein